MFLAGCDRVEPPVAAPTADVVLQAETEMVTDVVPRHTTLEKLLGDHGVAAETVQRLIAASQAVFDPRRLRAMQPFDALVAPKRNQAKGRKRFAHLLSKNKPRGASASGYIFAAI